MRVLCLYLPDLPTQVVQRTLAAPPPDSACPTSSPCSAPAGLPGAHAAGAQPSQLDAPLVLSQRSGASVLVAGACPRARSLGLYPGITLAQARAVAPELVVREFNPEQTARTLNQLAQWAMRFSPLVEPLEGASLVLDITGCDRLFAGEEGLIRQAVGGLAQQGFSARAAIADSVGGAFACAAGLDAAFTIVPEGQLSAYLAGLWPGHLRIPDRIAEQLHEVGVRSIGDLLMLPRSSLPGRFGPLLTLRIQQALGEVYEGVAVRRIQRQPCARRIFDGSLKDALLLQQVIEQLLSQLCQHLAAAGRRMRALDGVLYREAAPPVVLSLGFSRPVRAQEQAWPVLRQRLEQIDCSQGFCGILLIATQTTRWTPGQIDLFEPHDPQHEEALGEFLDRLANKIGDDALVQAELVADYQPECAVRYTPARKLTHNGKQGATNGAAQPARTLPRRRPPGKSAQQPAAWPAAAVFHQQTAATRPRPLRLFARPEPIRAIALAPDGPPTWLLWRGHEYTVFDADGPERIETAWWRSADVRRDYFRAITHTGEHFWLFADRPHRNWYLHGVFV